MAQQPTRRDILKLGGTAAASAFMFPALAGAAWKRLPIGTQLWCVRKQLVTDIPGTLNALSAMGYEGVELENAFGKPGAEWRKTSTRRSSRPAGSTTPSSELQGDTLAATIEFNQAIGNRNLIVRSLAPEVYKSADLLKKTADAMNEAADKVKPHKMRVGYHNHFADFNRIDGEYWWNRFADQTTKDVILQLDTGNASELTGVGLVDLIRRNTGRTVTMHVKPYLEEEPRRLHRRGRTRLGRHHDGCGVGGRPRVVHHRVQREGVPPLESLKANLDASRS